MKNYHTMLYIFFIFSILKAVNEIDTKYQYNLAICAIFQQEAPYLKEWIEFHKLVGVEYFILYNNFSTDNYMEILEPYIKEGQVLLIDWPIEALPNNAKWVLSAYNDALNKARGKIRWLAFLDLDEFLFPLKVNNLLLFLKDYEQYGGVGVNWVMFGTSFVKQIPKNSLMIEKLVYRAQDNYRANLHTKMIVHPHLVKSIPSQHFAYYKPGYSQVTASKEAYQGPFSRSIAINEIRINHYWTRDEDFFYNVKIPRRMKDMGATREATIRMSNELNKVIDHTIFKYIGSLKMKVKLQK